jgi:hypothetical protein
MLIGVLGFFLLILCFAIVSLAHSAEPEVEQYHVYEIHLLSGTTHDNPFDVTVWATIRGPEDRELDVPGFYDGEGIWKIRFSPDCPGVWLWTTTSDEPDLDGETGEIKCVPNTHPQIHGGLTIDADRPHHFVYQDGTRYFLVGYECDWLWALDLNSPDIRQLETFVHEISTYGGFNHVVTQAYAHYTKWARDIPMPPRIAPTELYAWEGTNESPDHERLNLKYWQHYDRVVSLLQEKGIIAHIMITVWNKFVNWPEQESADDDKFWKYVLARYQAYSNVVWDVSKEAQNRPDEYWEDRFEFVKKHDAHDRLVTIHSLWHRHEDLKQRYCDFISDQQHSKWHEHIIDRREFMERPVVNIEFGYEVGPIETYRVKQDPDEVRRRMWIIYMAGGYAVYYYNPTAWDVISHDVIPPGYSYCKHLYSFFTDTRYWEMEPRDDLVDKGYCLAKEGEEYIVYLPEADAVMLNVQETASQLSARWYNPRSGQRIEVDGEIKDGTHKFKPPDDFGHGDVVLYVTY